MHVYSQYFLRLNHCLKNFYSYLIIFFFFLSSLDAVAKGTCQPKFSLDQYPQKQVLKESKKNPVFVFFDGSLSMQGFVKDQAGQKNLYRDVVDDLQQISENVGTKTFYHRFGSTVEPIAENEIARVTKPRFYICDKSQAKCNNQETRLELAFKAAKANKNGTYIIVTDLFLSNKQLVGSTLSSLTAPLKSILKNGKSIGVFGVMSSFNGTIYDIPAKEGGTIKYKDAKKRPFYIIVIGDQKNINRIKNNLEEQHFIDPGDQYKYALITSSPVLQNLNQNKIITKDNISEISNDKNLKFEYSGNNLPVYNFDTRKNQKMTFDVKNSEIVVPGTGISSFNIKENLWSSKETSCRKINTSDWRQAKVKSISSWKANENDKLSINLFEKFPLKKLFTGYRYFYVASIYADKPGNLSEETFNDWSMRDSEAEDFKNTNPVVFKTLNLVKIIKILNSVAKDVFEPTLVANIALNFNLVKK